MTDVEILRCCKCGDLFSNNPDIAAKEYKNYVKKYHPDICKKSNANDIISHINLLYDEAKLMFSKGNWESSNSEILKINNGKRVAIRYLAKIDFEIGTSYICRNKLIYIIRKQYVHFYDNYISRLSSLRYLNSEMERVFKPVIPKIEFKYELESGDKCIVLEKHSEAFPLSKVITAYNGCVPDRHVGWIMSRLMNFCCILNFNGLSFNALNFDNVFIIPELHVVSIYGGWWYCVENGQKMIGTTKEIFNLMPVKEKGLKQATITTDIESIKNIGRKLINKQVIPEPFEKWLNSGSSLNPLDEFKKWDKALEDSYGQRTFIEMKLTEKDIYTL